MNGSYSLWISWAFVALLAVGLAAWASWTAVGTTLAKMGLGYWAAGLHAAAATALVSGFTTVGVVEVKPDVAE